MNEILQKGKKIFFSEQNTILSAAVIIAGMTIASQVLGLVRQRIVLHFFSPGEASLFFAALRLPELVFEVLVYGMFSSAFIPVFTKAFKKDEKEAWDTAGRVVTIGLLMFLAVGVVFAIFAENIYSVVAPGYSAAETAKIAMLARVLFISQGIFIVSYVLTSVLESLRRFLIPALAPIFYNLGLIIGTLTLSPTMGLMGPTIGVLAGALAHLLVQLPFAWNLGFRFKADIKPNPEVKAIAHLAAPRLADLSFQQLVDMTVLYFSSLISAASYTYFTLASSLQLAPVRLFGISLAKAALPTLTREADDPKQFRKTMLKTLYQIFFLILPFATTFIVLRIPTIRIFFGTSIFDWNSTVETGMVLSAFAVGIPFQATVGLLARSFYALHDTKTPVTISIVGDALVIISDFVLIKAFGLPTWALGAAFSLGAIVETIILLVLLNKKTKIFVTFAQVVPILKSFVAAIVSGGVMFFLLKAFDRWVWVTQLKRPVPFERFVLDTSYTVNLIALTVFVAVSGLAIYILISLLFKSEELLAITRSVIRPKVKIHEPVTIDNP